MQKHSGAFLLLLAFKIQFLEANGVKDNYHRNNGGAFFFIWKGLGQRLGSELCTRLRFGGECVAEGLEQDQGVLQKEGPGMEHDLVCLWRGDFRGISVPGFGLGSLRSKVYALVLVTGFLVQTGNIV